jgi:hypothetical protein
MSARALLQRIATAEQLDIAAIPEPESWALLAGTLVLVGRRRKAMRVRP